jgi:hypothetical protein
VGSCSLDVRLSAEEVFATHTQENLANGSVDHKAELPSNAGQFGSKCS